MKQSFKAFLLTMMCTALAFIAGAVYAFDATPVFALTQPEEAVVSDELIVVYESAPAAQAVQETEILAAEDISVGTVEPVADRVAEEGPAVLIRLEDESDAQTAREVLSQQEEVAYVQPNFRYRMMDAEEKTDENADEYRHQQYYLEAWDPTFRKNCGANVAGAWELMGGIRASSQAAPVTIAVLDSGCQVSHEDLKDAVDMEHAYNAVTKQVGADQIEDGSSHGTHVCGIAAATSENGLGIAGASGNYARVLPINVFVGKWADTADMVTAYAYLEELMDSGELTGLHVINMSLGGYGDPDESDFALESYINRMREKDVLTVCAGGNGDEQYGLAYKDMYEYPGDFEACMCVTSLDSAGTNSIFSDYSMEKDISAPGSAILSTMTDVQGTFGEGKDRMYGYLSGTSMASPLVAGIAALLWADNPQLSADQVYESIIETAAPVNPAVCSHEGETGSAGAIDAAAAMNYAREHFDTQRKNIRQAQIEPEKTVFNYDGEEHKPKVCVTYDGVELTEKEDYILSHWNCVETGTAMLTVTGIGEYIGSVHLEYTIAPADISNAQVSMDPPDFTYDGAYHFPKLTVMMYGQKLKWGSDYNVTAESDGTRAGTHTIRLEGKGNYCGMQEVSYQIIREEPQPEPAVKKGASYTVSGSVYKVTKAGAAGAVMLTKAKNAKKVTVPAKVKLADGNFYKVMRIGSKAFAKSKAQTVTVKTKTLTKTTVKGCLKGSKVKTVRVSVGTKKVNQKYVKKYQKIFTKKIAGKKVKVL